MVGIEGHVIQPGLLSWYHWLGADRVILVYMEVKDMDFAVDCHCSENSAGVRSPSNVANLRIQVKHEQWLPAFEKGYFQNIL